MAAPTSQLNNYLFKEYINCSGLGKTYYDTVKGKGKDIPVTGQGGP
jgi:hypothetical protein